MIDAKEKTLRDFVHEAIVPLIEDVLVKKLYQALEVVVSEIKPPRKEWVGLTDDEIADVYVEWDNTNGTSFADFARTIEAQLKELNT